MRDAAIVVGEMSWHDTIDASAPTGFKEWARTQPSIDAAWAACNRADWLIWLASRRATNDDTRRTIIRAAANAIEAGPRPWGERGFMRLFDRDWEVASLWARGGVDEMQAAAGAARVLTWAGFFALFPASFVYYWFLYPRHHAPDGRLTSTFMLNLELGGIYAACTLVFAFAIHRLRQSRLRAQLSRRLDAAGALAIVDRELAATVARAPEDRRRFQATLVRNWLPTPPAN